MKKVNLTSLNPEQRRAVETIEGPLLVLAGAGSGKTRVITYRIAHMIASGIKPRNILAMTFTNKAANEMRERLGALVGIEEAKALTVSTFHALGVRILREQGHILGLGKQFIIYTPSEIERMVKAILKEQYKVDSPDAKTVSTIVSQISHVKTNFITPEQLAHSANSDLFALTARVYQHYAKYLQIYNAVDFDDLILKPIELFEQHPDILDHYQRRFRYILVDEYQDTNDAQFKSIDLLSEKYKNLCVVGDDDQSIYGFRGANVTNILNFTTAFPNAVEIKLERNYRSTKNILDAANSVIAQNKQRKAKNLRATGACGDPILLYVTKDGEEQGQKISNKIKMLNRYGTSYNDIAVMYRSNHQARQIETVFTEREIPYHVVGGTSFFDRKEVKDLISYLVILINEKDEIHLKRVLNYPPRGIGTTTVEKIGNYAKQNRCNFITALRKAPQLVTAKKSLEGIKTFLDIIDHFQDMVHNAPTFEELLIFLEKTGLVSQIFKENKDGKTAENKRKNLIFILEYISKYLSYGGRTLRDYLITHALEPESAKEEEKNEVTLLSIHASKGLEFPYVFLLDFSENIMPHQRSVDTGKASDIEEERRLCYVAITRAKKQLIICCPKMRRTHGQVFDCEPSRFLSEIPKNLLDTIHFGNEENDLNENELIDIEMEKISALFDNL